MFCIISRVISAFLFFCAVLISCAESAPAQQGGLHVWAIDPLTKVLPHTTVVAQPVAKVRMEAVRNEYESAQVVVTAGTKGAKLQLQTTPVQGSDGPKPRIEAAFLGFVPVRRGTQQTPDNHLVAKPPAEIPDPILEARTVNVLPGENQPIWLTVYVPKGCSAGVYTSELVVTADNEHCRIPVSILVRAVTLPDERTLQVTNWYSPGNIAAGHGLAKNSEAYWKMLESYARVMADHRQNLARALLFDLITAREDAQGRLTFDFSLFDRWVDVFKRAGVLGTIEGSHLAYRSSWKDPDFLGHRPITRLPDGSEKVWEKVKVTSSQQRDFLSQFLPALRQHLEKTGWLNHYVQHLADEPVALNAKSYNGLAEMVHELLPGVKTIDATMCREVAGSVDIWVPQPSEIDKNWDFFLSRKKLGEQIWIYTCLSPKGRYMNRFIDYHLLGTRLMHWMNFKYDFPGYLHWGLNFWLGDPFQNVERGYPEAGNLPAGDSHIVYPGRFGPVRSIRLEAMRDGVEDFELLRMLSLSNKKKAQDICDSVVRSMTDYTLDPAEFRRVRTRLLDAIEEIK